MTAPVERAALEARMARDREELREALEGLRDKALDSLDVRLRIQARPGAWLIGALLLGACLGARR